MNRFSWLKAALPTALALSVLALGLRFTNQYGVYPLKRLVYLPLVLIVILPITLLVFWRGWPLWQRTPGRERRKTRRETGWIALFLLPLVAWLLPLPSPALYAPHKLVIQPIEGTQVEIRKLTDLNGSPIPDSALQMTPDWQTEGEVIYSNGLSNSRLVVQGNLAGGMVIGMRYLPEGGSVILEWDGNAQIINLAAREGLVLTTILSEPVFWNIAYSPLQTLATLILITLASGGLYILLFLSLASAYSLFGLSRARPLTAVAVMAALLVGFSYLKTSSLSADIPRVFRDTYAYVQTAALSLTDLQFWAGTRAFSLPLFLKLFGTTLTNYSSNEQMQRIFLTQLALSALSWTALAAVIAAAAPRRWFIRVFLFGLVLFFSLSLEIGLWDALLLSESLTFSLFALTLASWLALVTWLPKIQRAGLRLALLITTGIITLLYTFTRDSNIYFVIIGAGILLLCWILGWIKARRKETAAFALASALLFLAQSFSLSAGNRWQIFMFDHLAVRFLPDPAAVQFFAAEGLPLSDRLMETTHMAGYEYQSIYMQDPAFQPVRDWVITRSKGAYLKYLLSQPGRTLLDPLLNAPKLLWGSNLEYRSPLGGVTPVPSQLSFLTALFYPRYPLALAALFLTALAGIYFYWREANPLWVLLAVLLVTLYPMMFIVWHGEPLEIERHAAQLGIQFHLAGWLGLAEILSVGIHRI